MNVVPSPAVKELLVRAHYVGHIDTHAACEEVRQEISDQRIQGGIVGVYFGIED